MASSSGSLRHRRPLISPARLNLKGQRLLLFSAPGEAPSTPSSSEEHSPPSGSLVVEPPQLVQRTHVRDTKHSMGMWGGPEACSRYCHGSSWLIPEVIWDCGGAL